MIRKVIQNIVFIIYEIRMSVQQNISVVTSEYEVNGEKKGRRTKIWKLITKDNWKQFISFEDWFKNYIRLPLWPKFEWIANVAPPYQDESSDSLPDVDEDLPF